ncbi:TolC family outer membrane protein [Pseudohongiella spirulinae]|uniref:Outer membrane efflux protein n=1 Tax=Pseudohongiella spirulinae TaxID=1249552 RepID=A0A0S2KA95_9GAMM|nr:TolC family outer membrane protein [Pseudohongiella spirulinae]ALO45045.1 Outer membrane efflux protein [Pseudohongiella spirulinae]
MQRFIRKTVLAAGVFFAAQSAFADDLVTILELAMRNDPALRQAQAQLRSGQQQLTLARASLLPQANASVSEQRQSTGPAGDISYTSLDASSRRYSLGINQSLLNMPNWYSYQGAKEADKARLYNFQAQEQDLIIRVASAYFNVLRAIDDLTTRRQEEEAAQRQFERTRQREEVGLVAITEVYEAQAVYDLARNNTILAEDTLASRYEALEAITGQPHPNIDILREDFPVMEADGNIEEWVQEALNNNPQLLAARAGVEAQTMIAKARRADRLPTVNLQGGYSHSETNSGQGADGSVRSIGAIEGVSVTLSVSVPLFSGYAVTARKEQAEYDLVAQQESANLARRQITQDIRNAYRRVNTDALVIAQRQQAIISAEAALNAIEAGYEVGTRNIVDVLQARQQLFVALRNYSDARYNYVVDTLQLKRTAGVLTPQDIIDLNQWLSDQPATAQ